MLVDVKELLDLRPREAKLLGGELGDSALTCQASDRQRRATACRDDEVPVLWSALEHPAQDRPHVVRIADEVEVVQHDERPLGRQLTHLGEQ